MRVFLAAPISHLPVFIENDPMYVLETFYEIRKSSKKKELMSYVKSKPTDAFLLDSGAFTFMNASSGKAVDYDKYVEEYAKFIVDFGITQYFELDIDCIVGLAKVEEYRAFLYKNTKVAPIPVWHKTRGFEYFKKMAQDFSYIAIGISGMNDVSKWSRSNPHVLKQMCRVAASLGAKVHGLGYTKISDLHTHSFYSVDSSSWKAGMRYGSLHVFDELSKKLAVVKKPRNTRLSLDHNAVASMSLSAWNKFVFEMEKNS